MPPLVRHLLPLLLAAAIALPALAQTTDIVTREVNYTHDELDLRGYFARPDTDDIRPGVVVVHAWRGHSDYARRRAEMLAELGYAAFALDMYGAGVYAETSDEASRRANVFYNDRDLLRARFKAGYETMLDQQGVDPDRTAAIGYCFGGTVVLELARTGVDVGVELDAVTSFHAGLEFQTAPEPGDIVASVLVCNGQADPLVPYEQRKAFMREMEAAGADFIFIEYAGAKHSFTDPSAGSGDGPVAYQKTADERSWAHMQQHFRSVLTTQNAEASSRADAPATLSDQATDLARSYMTTLDDATGVLSGISGRLDALRAAPRLNTLREDIATLASELRSLSPETRSLLAGSFGEEIAARTDAFLSEIQRLATSANVSDTLLETLKNIPFWRPAPETTTTP